MKNLTLLSSIGSVLLAAAPASHAVITAYAVDFNGGASSFIGNFLAANDNSTTSFAWGAASGVGGGGGLDVTNAGQDNIFYRPTPESDGTSAFNMAGLSTGQGFRNSADFRWSNTTAVDLTVINIGFSVAHSSVSAMSSVGSMGGSVIRNGNTDVNIRLRTGNGNVQTLAFGQSSLTAGSWYRLTYDVVKSTTTDTFNTIVTLYSIGADGLAAPVLFNDGTKNITLAGGTTAAALYADADAFSVYDIRNVNGTGIAQVDNLSVSFLVPEPTAPALLALGGVALGLRRRRR